MKYEIVITAIIWLSSIINQGGKNKKKKRIRKKNGGVECSLPPSPPLCSPVTQDSYWCIKFSYRPDSGKTVKENKLTEYAWHDPEKKAQFRYRK